MRSPRNPRVFVHLDQGRSPQSWKALFAAGSVLDDAPYGYAHAGAHLDLVFSVDADEGRTLRFIRRGLAYITGLDVIHAYRNREGLRAADIVWTHTEHEHLAIAMLIKFGIVPWVPVIAQSVWLWDEWDGHSPLRRRILRWLLQESALHTTLSPVNARIATRALGQRVAALPFGMDDVIPWSPRRERLNGASNASTPLRVLSLGSDRHRDWPLLRQTAAVSPHWQVRVLSGRRAARKSGKGPANYEATRAGGVAAVLEAYRWADVVVVPLNDNHHASGVTVANEALQAGRPVVIADTGGVREYYSDLVTYYSVGNAHALVEAVEAAAASTASLTGFEALVARGLTASDYAWRHVLLTRELLASPAKLSSAVLDEVEAFRSLTRS